MAMVKATVAGAAVGALALATILFVAPIAAQGPGGPPYGAPRDSGGPRDRGDITGPGVPRSGDMMGPGMMNRRGPDPNDPDITGPRGEVANCQERLARMGQLRLQRIAFLVRPTEEQRGAFEELRMASAKAVEILRAACPTERPLTPTARMAQAEKWLDARLQAIRLVRPALDSFYRLLTDEQKIRWSMGPRPGDRFGQDRRGQFDERGPDRRAPGVERRGDEHRGDDRRGEERRGEERRGEERWRDGRDSYGDERGRNGDDRYGERRRDDDRYGRREQQWRERGRGIDPEEERF